MTLSKLEDELTILGSQVERTFKRVGELYEILGLQIESWPPVNDESASTRIDSNIMVVVHLANNVDFINEQLNSFSLLLDEPGNAVKIEVETKNE